MRDRFTRGERRSIKLKHNPDLDLSLSIMAPREESDSAKKELRKRILDSDSIYFLANAPAIGDSVITSAYFKAFMQGLGILCKGEGKQIPPVTLVTNKKFEGIFNGVAELFPNVSVMEIDSLEPHTVRPKENLLEKGNVVVLDFAGYRNLWAGGGNVPPEPELITEESDEGMVTTASFLLGSAIYNYRYEYERKEQIKTPETRFRKVGRHEFEYQPRYAHFIEDLLRLPKGSISPQKTQTEIVLPENADSLANTMRERNGLKPKSGPEITISIEASTIWKKYSIANWAQVITRIHSKLPDFKINLLFNEKNSTAEELNSELEKNGEADILSYCKPVSGSLPEVAAFLNTQDAFAGNDSGTSHMAAALDKPTVAILEPRAWAHDTWRSRTNLHFVDILEIEGAANIEDAKIDDIPPESVAEMIVSSLSA